MSEKNETSERNEPRGSLGRGIARRYFSYLTPFFAFSLTSETGPRLPPPFLSPVSSRFIFMHVRASHQSPRTRLSRSLKQASSDGACNRMEFYRQIQEHCSPLSFPQKKTCFRVIVILSESTIDHWMSLNCTESEREFSWLIRKKKTWKELQLKYSSLISCNRLDH